MRMSRSQGHEGRRTPEAPEPIAFGFVRVDPDLILRLQKYRRPDRVSPVVREAARRMASLAEALVEPRGWMRWVPVSAVGPQGQVRMAHDIEFCSPALARRLQDAVEAVLIALTIGPALEERAEQFVADQSPAEGLLLDTAGWVAIDAMLKDIRQRLGAEARVRGCRLTGRMAPGFIDWPLDQQRVLLSAFTVADLSIRLTETFVMLPRKSASAVYGLVPVGRAGTA
jgi:hypothetical protein